MTANQAKNFLISGAGRGIGRGLSRLLLQQGHRVFLLDVNKVELEHTVAKLSVSHSRGEDFEATLCDLRRPPEIRSAVRQAHELFKGHLDVLINNAANTTGISASRPQGGNIIHMSSTRAFMSEPNNEPYSATKAGLLGLTQSMAVSLAPQGIRVNAILPGWINVTDECKQADESGQKWEDGLSKDDHEWHLTGRVGRVEDVLRAVEYLCDAEFVTGVEMVVDGGVTRKMVYPE
ncbi:hypothetical protein LTR02_009242 [Friedmanniomyces endolithicus]|nr:hypothetical protein LTR94_012376 [Friedmanniomyces endolithicus]KAK0782212.1 hypothetical protein LTR75_014466 [Friedmanniomyces endolithicus]KAK0818767.1 hypothetical protein LTR38_000865 [Friedmanniomyces endolithicus]KAK0855209.1 hypothetical protein LTR03_001975 [Friedmanniomyces endolithicus]KAK0859273.1 hypothetical protein LTS02_009360 [Friedmanniomyces endolithicus]